MCHSDPSKWHEVCGNLCNSLLYYTGIYHSFLCLAFTYLATDDNCSSYQFELFFCAKLTSTHVCSNLQQRLECLLSFSVKQQTSFGFRFGFQFRFRFQFSLRRSIHLSIQKLIGSNFFGIKA